MTESIQITELSMKDYEFVNSCLLYTSDAADEL